MSLTAVFRKIGQDSIHAVVLRPVNQVATAALLRNEIGAHKLFQMKRKRIAWYARHFSQYRRRETVRALDYQGSKNPKSTWLGQRCQRNCDAFTFHNSILLEIFDRKMSNFGLKWVTQAPQARCLE